LDLWDVKFRGLTVAAMPVWQSSRKEAKTMIETMLVERLPEINFLYLSPEFIL
jgi:hypothetical protein